MDFQKTKLLLDKVNALYKSMSADPSQVADIERDLMRNYLRQLYEHFMEASSSVSPPPVIPSVPAPPPATPPAPVPEPALEVIKSEPAPPPPAPPVEPATTYTPPRIIEVPDSVKEINEEVQEVFNPRVDREPEPIYQAPAQPIPGGEDMEELFSTSEAKELSEKLSALPIADLTKAMGLNERIFTINELFGGDQQLFNNTMAQLNQFSSFLEASRYLAQEVAEKQNWTKKSKKKKAKEFIKLVKRRYN
ncbi:MAG: hypothetical protein AAGH79_09685 [Bacteroidota bacterium]